MERLRVAVIVEENCLPTEGGGYTYYQSLIKQLDSYPFSDEIEISFLLPFTARKGYPFLKKTILTRSDVIDRAFNFLLTKLYSLVHKLTGEKLSNVLERLTVLKQQIANRNSVTALKKANSDIVYYLKPNDTPMNYPMIVTHWDVGHKSMYPFPEVAAKGNYQKREQYYMSMLSKAMLIICESRSGAEELAHFYPVNEEKLKVLPLFAGEVVHLQISEREQSDALSKYNLVSGRFFLYPAQFWAHKNHFNLILAFHRLLRTTGNEDIRLVLCGADQGNLDYIKTTTRSLGLQNNVVFTGFINNRVLNAFYKNAIALVMPTFLGPTNLPLIEAALLNCPVICSDFKGHREIMGDAALYINPAKPEEITSSMSEMLLPEVQNRFRKIAFDHINNSDFNLKSSIQVLEKILLEIKPVRKAWGSC